MVDLPQCHTPADPDKQRPAKDELKRLWIQAIRESNAAMKFRAHDDIRSLVVTHKHGPGEWHMRIPLPIDWEGLFRGNLCPSCKGKMVVKKSQVECPSCRMVIPLDLLKKAKKEMEIELASQKRSREFSEKLKQWGLTEEENDEIYREALQEVERLDQAEETTSQSGGPEGDGGADLQPWAEELDMSGEGPSADAVFNDEAKLLAAFADRHERARKLLEAGDRSCMPQVVELVATLAEGVDPEDALRLVGALASPLTRRGYAAPAATLYMELYRQWSEPSLRPWQEKAADQVVKASPPNALYPLGLDAWPAPDTAAAQTHFQQAMQAARSGDIRAAHESFREASALDRGHHAALFCYGLAAARMNFGGGAGSEIGVPVAALYALDAAFALKASARREDPAWEPFCRWFAEQHREAVWHGVDERSHNSSSPWIALGLIARYLGDSRTAQDRFTHVADWVESGDRFAMVLRGLSGGQSPVAMPTSIRILCPNCGKVFRTAPSNIGKKAVCSQCGKSFTAAEEPGSTRDAGSEAPPLPQAKPGRESKRNGSAEPAGGRPTLYRNDNRHFEIEPPASAWTILPAPQSVSADACAAYVHSRRKECFLWVIAEACLLTLEELTAVAVHATVANTADFELVCSERIVQDDVPAIEVEYRFTVKDKRYIRRCRFVVCNETAYQVYGVLPDCPSQEAREILCPALSTFRLLPGSAGAAEARRTRRFQAGSTACSLEASYPDWTETIPRTMDQCVLELRYKGRTDTWAMVLLEQWSKGLDEYKAALTATVASRLDKGTFRILREARWPGLENSGMFLEASGRSGGMDFRYLWAIFLVGGAARQLCCLSQEFLAPLVRGHMSQLLNSFMRSQAHEKVGQLTLEPLPMPPFLQACGDTGRGKETNEAAVPKVTTLPAVTRSGNLLPFAPSLSETVRDASEEEIARTRERITAWADSVPGHSHKRLGEKITVVAARVISVLDLRSQTVTERREILERFWRIRPEDTARPPRVTRGNFDVWRINLSFGNETEGEVEVEIPDSAERITCPQCNGSPSVPCGNCGGVGKAECPICNGTSFITCPACGGTGRWPPPENFEKCRWCSGEGRVRCMHCAEKAIIEGEVLALINRNAYPPDPRRYRGVWVTGGSKLVTCAACAGSGKVTCGNCEGRGQIIRTLAVKGVRRKYEESVSMAPAKLPDFHGATITSGDILHIAKPRISRDDLPPMTLEARQCILAILDRATNTADPNARTLSQEVRIAGYAFLSLDFEHEGKAYNFLMLKDGSPVMSTSPLGGSMTELRAMLKEADGRLAVALGVASVGAIGACIVSLLIFWALLGFLWGVGLTAVTAVAGGSLGFLYFFRRAIQVMRELQPEKVKSLAVNLGIDDHELAAMIKREYPTLNLAW